MKKAVTGYEHVIGKEMSLQWRRDSEPLSSHQSWTWCYQYSWDKRYSEQLGFWACAQV